MHIECHRTKSSPGLTFQRNADNYSIRDKLWKVPPSFYVLQWTWPTCIGFQWIRVAPTQQVKCSWGHRTPAFAGAGQWNQPQAIKQARGIILVTCNSEETYLKAPRPGHFTHSARLHWRRFAYLRLVSLFLAQDCRNLVQGLWFTTLNIIVIITWTATISVISSVLAISLLWV